MSKLKKFRGPCLAVLLMMASFFICSISLAKDYETPHEFKPGDVISADMMNEIFEKIQSTEKEISSNDLVGTWNCKWTTQKTSWFNELSGASTDQDNLVQWRTDAVTFTDDGDGTFSFTTSQYDIFYANAYRYNSEYLNKASNGNYIIVNNVFYYKVNWAGDERGSLYVKSMSDTRLIFDNGGREQKCIICDKQNLPPAHPTQLSATTSDLTVNLSWTDNSSDETGFKIVRKDTLEGTYSQVGTAAANTTSYSDTVSAEGKYWYRVKATNANGDSVGSNVVKVRISQ